MSYYDTETLQRLKLLGWDSPEQGKKTTAEARARDADLVDDRQGHHSPAPKRKWRARVGMFGLKRASLFAK